MFFLPTLSFLLSFPRLFRYSPPHRIAFESVFDRVNWNSLYSSLESAFPRKSTQGFLVLFSGLILVLSSLSVWFLAKSYESILARRFLSLQLPYSPVMDVGIPPSVQYPVLLLPVFSP